MDDSTKALEEVREILSRTIPQLNLANSNEYDLYVVAYHVKVSAMATEDLLPVRRFLKRCKNGQL